MVKGCSSAVVIEGNHIFALSLNYVVNSKNRSVTEMQCSMMLNINLNAKGKKIMSLVLVPQFYK